MYSEYKKNKNIIDISDININSINLDDVDNNIVYDENSINSSNEYIVNKDMIDYKYK
ncbi:12843_t:CDS:1, partial [Gigaspora margarita]